MHFDFEAAVTAPFRMQPGLRRMQPSVPHLTPLEPGSRHQREKLAVLSAFWPRALVQRPGFEAGPALAALCAHAANEHPGHWAWDGERASALALGTAVHAASGAVQPLAAGVFGLGDEVPRCLLGLPPAWRLAGLLALAFAEDLAIVDAEDTSIPWLAVALPSHWEPPEKVGRPFAEVHAPVADAELVRRAGAQLMKLVSGHERWERFVWNVTGHPRLCAHPAVVAPERWDDTPIKHAFWRTEHQSFVPLPTLGQAVFTIGVQVRPLAEALTTPTQARALHDAIASMSPAVLEYRNLASVRAPLLGWLAERAGGTAQPPN
jgi:dimethylamine monooxygenase subunit A